ncbi:hypothetical protein DMC47_25325 [Nostoc sp. 3335mG]|nr:hypothetical protein DMC47_25325 [Nostoc sp. 3335mG]
MTASSVAPGGVPSARARNSTACQTCGQRTATCRTRSLGVSSSADATSSAGVALTTTTPAVAVSRIGTGSTTRARPAGRSSGSRSGLASMKPRTATTVSGRTVCTRNRCDSVCAGIPLARDNAALVIPSRRQYRSTSPLRVAPLTPRITSSPHRRCEWSAARHRRCA